jgi:hypothetical protein
MGIGKAHGKRLKVRDFEERKEGEEQHSSKRGGRLCTDPVLALLPSRERGRPQALDRKL